jgi:hypothetical protein
MVIEARWVQRWHKIPGSALSTVRSQKGTKRMTKGLGLAAIANKIVPSNDAGDIMVMLKEGLYSPPETVDDLARKSLETSAEFEVPQFLDVYCNINEND